MSVSNVDDHQQGETMLQQSSLPFKFEATKTSGATALAGLALYLELCYKIGFIDMIRRALPESGGQGWSAADVVLTLVLLNLAGGDSVADVELLRRDEGFVKLAVAVACYGLPRKEARAKARLLKKTKAVPFPAPSSVFRFLDLFHGLEQDVERVPGEATLVPEHSRLLGLWQVNRELLGFMQKQRPLDTATLDCDATLVETHKAEALHCYKGYKAYQPLNFYIFEWSMIAYSHFRDGNVPCGYRQLESVQRALKLLPAGIKHVKLRMDTQGYEWELLRWLAEGKSERFGAIDFAVGADVTQELKKEVAKLQAKDWHDLTRKAHEVAQQWAEVAFVPNACATKKDGPMYRFIVTREALRQPSLPGVAVELPFPTMDFGGIGPCKLHAVVTNTKLGGAELVAWYRQRCGKSEEAHSVMKSDLAGGKLPSGDFGANAAWWTIMQIALNLNQMLKRLAMPESWLNKRLKAIRAHVICVAARVVDHARQVVVRLSAAHPSTAFIQEIRERILALEGQPSG